MIMSFHSCTCVSVSLWVLNEIINLAPYAQELIAMMVKAEDHWKNKLEGKIVQGSASPVK